MKIEFTTQSKLLKVLEVPDTSKDSLLDLALDSGVDIDHACGGVRACSTCHVILREGATACNEATDEELDQLDKAPGLTPHSRLACQVVPKPGSHLVAEIPTWNRNLVREGK